MKGIDKIILLLLILSVLAVVVGHLVAFEKNNEPEDYWSVQCFNQICDKYDKPYCLDCNLSCKPEFCDSEIVVLCKNCLGEQEKSLPGVFEKMKEVYSCLSDFYGYSPSSPIYFVVGKADYSCWGECVPYMGKDKRIVKETIHGPSYRTILSHDVHEIAHVFTNYGLKGTPIWFNEGISIYTESKVYCIPDYELSAGTLDNFLIVYNWVKEGKKTLDEVAPYDEYYKVEHNAHRIGAMYFSALEQDYGCGKECVSGILYSLHNQSESPTNKLIKQKSEEVVGQDLTALFELLEIDFVGV